MTIKDLAEVQTKSIEIRVMQKNDEEKNVQIAAFTSDNYDIIKDDFLSQTVSEMEVSKTNGNTPYMQVVVPSAESGSGSDSGSDNGTTSDAQDGDTAPGTGDAEEL